MKPKPIKLRAFRVENNDISKAKSNLQGVLTTKLNATTANERRMQLNQDDAKREEDLISDFNASKNFLTGVILRITHAEDVPNIPDQLLEHKKISINELDNMEHDSSVVYKGHYYFLLNDEYVITNLRGNLPIKRFQVYLNWILEELRGDTLYEITPIVTEHEVNQLKDLKGIVVKDSTINADTSVDETGLKRLNLSEQILSKLFQDVTNIDELVKNNIVSAFVTLKFKRPKGLSKDEYQKSLGAYLKPISETDDVSFLTKNHGRITGSEILKTKIVDIEFTETNKISEPALYQEMEIFLHELKDEKQA